MSTTEAKAVPNLPYKSPVINKEGYLTAPWAGWFRDLFNRVGGTLALTNVQLEELQSSDLTAVQADIDALQSTAASLVVLVAALQVNIQDLNQGRQV